MNATPAGNTLEVTLPTDTQIAMTRTLNAPREIVFDAFTKPELIKQWLLGPDGWSMPVCVVDLRIGGTLKYRWRNDEDGKEFGVEGAFRAVERPARLVHDELFDDVPEAGRATVETTFVERDGATIVTMTVDYGSRSVRDMVIETGMSTGVATSYDRLEKVLGLAA
jgi:uncharacterized protein YndB with AHSA1/START domain